MRPHFIDMHDGGRRFLIEFPPPPLMRPHGTVLMIQPFAEEFNLCRRVLAEQARRLSERGWHILLPELFATGDSDGDESSITLARWREDLDYLTQRAREQTPGPLVVIAPRLAALLAVDLAKRRAGLVQAIVLWQVPETGNRILDPVMKVTLIGDERQVAQSVVEAELHSSSVRVAGVSYLRAFISELAALSAGASLNAPSPASLRVQLIQVARNELALKRGTERLVTMIDTWRAAGCQTGLDAVIAEPFWASMEPTLPEAVFIATERFLDEFLATRYTLPTR